MEILFDLPQFLFGIFVFTLAFGKPLLEFKNALAEALADFREAATKNEQADTQNDGPFKRTGHAKSELKGVKVDMSIPLGRSSVRRTHPSVVRSLKPMRHTVLIAAFRLDLLGLPIGRKGPEEDLLGKYERPLPAGAPALRKVPTSQWPKVDTNFRRNPTDLVKAGKRSLAWFDKKAPPTTSPSKGFPTPMPKRPWSGCCNFFAPQEAAKRSPARCDETSTAT